MQIVVELSAPEPILSPNARGSWRGRFRFVGAYREEAYYATITAMGRRRLRWPAARATARIYWPSKRKLLDDDNALGILKAAFDGIADSGIVPNDRMLTRSVPEQLADGSRPRVEITLEEVLPE